jgi:hypothetical protein
MGWRQIQKLHHIARRILFDRPNRRVGDNDQRQSRVNFLCCCCMTVFDGPSRVGGEIAITGQMAAIASAKPADSLQCPRYLGP